MPPRTYTKEADVKAEVKKLLTKHKWFWWMPAANGYGRPGASDFMALRGGVFLCVETKFGKNKPTPAQRAFLETITAESGFGFVVNETNLPAFATFLHLFDVSARLVAEKRQMSSADGATMLDCLALLTADIVSAKPE